LFVAVDKHISVIFTCSDSYVFILPSSSSGSAKYSEYYESKRTSDFGILEPACAPFAHGVIVLKATRHSQQVADTFNLFAAMKENPQWCGACQLPTPMAGRSN
jgi:hypothetical protein